MRSGVEQGETVADLKDGSGTADARGGAPVWTLGSRLTTSNVRTVRRAYLRCAEGAERVLNSADTSTSRVSETLWTMADAAREALRPLRGPGFESAPTAECGAAALKAKVARGRADLRDIVLRGQIAADTNVRAYLDHLDDLATVPSARKLVSAQTSYVWDQWQRSLKQALDLQRRTIAALRKIAFTSSA